MVIYGWYLLKVSICIILFYGFYLLLLRHYTFFRLNRLYLFLGLFASFIIPLLNVPIFGTVPEILLSTIIHSDLFDPEYELFQPQNLSDHAKTVSYSKVLPVIYFAGISILLVKLLFSIKRIIRIKKRSVAGRIGATRIVRMSSGLPFSFFHLAFLPENENDPMIIRHEIAHIKQLHWIDLVLLEVASILLWFNPFLILYKRSVKLQHEYLADAFAVNGEDQTGKYLYSMLKQIEVVSYGGITSQFYCKTLKKRITMITKNKTPNSYSGAYLLTIPLICLMLFIFSGHTTLAQQIPPISSTNEPAPNDLNEPSLYPVDPKRIKSFSGYGERTNPRTNKKTFHYGIDFAIAEGEKVNSTATGVVTEAKFDPGKGNYVIVRHSETFSTLYSHLKSLSVKAGDQLGKGQLIGFSGNTGTSTGPHLHYEVIMNDKRVDPKTFLPH